MSDNSTLATTGRNKLVDLRMRRALNKGFDTAVWSYPKSGSTWLRFLLSGCITQDTTLTFEALDQLAGDFEAFVPTSRAQRRSVNLFDSEIPLKSHDLPSNAWFRDAKTIFLVRDPVHILDSARRHIMRNGRDEPSTAELVQELSVSSLFNYAPWKQQVECALQQQELGRVHILSYEDLVADPTSSLRACLSFLDLQPATDELLAAVIAGYDKKSLAARETGYRNTEGFVSTVKRDPTLDLREAVEDELGEQIIELSDVSSNS